MAAGIDDGAAADAGGLVQRQAAAQRKLEAAAARADELRQQLAARRDAAAALVDRGLERAPALEHELRARGQLQGTTPRARFVRSVAAAGAVPGHGAAGVVASVVGARDAERASASAAVKAALLELETRRDAVMEAMQRNAKRTQKRHRSLRRQQTQKKYLEERQAQHSEEDEDVAPGAPVGEADSSALLAPAPVLPDGPLNLVQIGHYVSSLQRGMDEHERAIEAARRRADLTAARRQRAVEARERTYDGSLGPKSYPEHLLPVRARVMAVLFESIVDRAVEVSEAKPTREQTLEDRKAWRARAHQWRDAMAGVLLDELIREEVITVVRNARAEIVAGAQAHVSFGVNLLAASALSNFEAGPSLGDASEKMWTLARAGGVAGADVIGADAAAPAASEGNVEGDLELAIAMELDGARTRERAQQWDDSLFTAEEESESDSEDSESESSDEELGGLGGLPRGDRKDKASVIVHERLHSGMGAMATEMRARRRYAERVREEGATESARDGSAARHSMFGAMAVDSKDTLLRSPDWPREKHTEVAKGAERAFWANVRLYATDRGKRGASAISAGSRHKVSCVRPSPTGRLLAVGTSEGDVLVYDLRRSPPARIRHCEHERARWWWGKKRRWEVPPSTGTCAVIGMAWSVDQRQLATTDVEGTVRVWRFKGAKAEHFGDESYALGLMALTSTVRVTQIPSTSISPGIKGANEIVEAVKDGAAKQRLREIKQMQIEQRLKKMKHAFGIKGRFESSAQAAKEAQRMRERREAGGGARRPPKPPAPKNSGGFFGGLRARKANKVAAAAAVPTSGRSEAGWSLADGHVGDGASDAGLSVATGVTGKRSAMGVATRLAPPTTLPPDQALPDAIDEADYEMSIADEADVYSQVPEGRGRLGGEDEGADGEVRGALHGAISYVRTPPCFHPSFSVVATQPYVVVAALNGDIVRLCVGAKDGTEQLLTDALGKFHDGDAEAVRERERETDLLRGSLAAHGSGHGAGKVLSQAEVDTMLPTLELNDTAHAASVYRAHNAYVVYIGFLPDSACMVSVDMDGVVVVWPQGDAARTGFGWYSPSAVWRLPRRLETLAPVHAPRTVYPNVAAASDIDVAEAEHRAAERRLKKARNRLKAARKATTRDEQAVADQGGEQSELKAAQAAFDSARTIAQDAERRLLEARDGFANMKSLAAGAGGRQGRFFNKGRRGRGGPGSAGGEGDVGGSSGGGELAVYREMDRAGAKWLVRPEGGGAETAVVLPLTGPSLLTVADGEDPRTSNAARERLLPEGERLHLIRKDQHGIITAVMQQHFKCVGGDTTVCSALLTPSGHELVLGAVVRPPDFGHGTFPHVSFISVTVTADGARCDLPRIDVLRSKAELRADAQMLGAAKRRAAEKGRKAGRGGKKRRGKLGRGKHAADSISLPRIVFCVTEQLMGVGSDYLVYAPQTLPPTLRVFSLATAQHIRDFVLSDLDQSACVDSVWSISSQDALKAAEERALSEAASAAAQGGDKEPREADEALAERRRADAGGRRAMGLYPLSPLAPLHPPNVPLARAGADRARAFSLSLWRIPSLAQEPQAPLRAST